MLTRWTLPILCLTLLQFSPSAAADDPADFADLKARMLKAAEDVKTWSADVNTKMGMQGMNMNMKSSMQGIGDQFTATMDMQMPGQSMKMRSVVDNDNMMWIEMDMGGFKQIMKMDMALVQQLGGGNPASQFGGGGNTPFNTNQHPLKGVADLESLYNMKLEGPADVNGAPAYVVSGTMKDDAAETIGQAPGGAAAMAEMMSGVRMAVRQSDYFPLQIQMLGPNGDAALTIDYENIQVNPEIDPSIFDYTPPPGANVMDMTPILRQQLGAQNN